MPYQANIEGRVRDVDILTRRPRLCVEIAGARHDIDNANCPAGGEFKIAIDGCVYRGWRYATAEDIYIRLNGRTFVVTVPQFGVADGAAGHAEDEVRADMPGTVVAVHCVMGDTVSSGQKLVTIESMKLQISMVAPRDGRIAVINAAPNATFDRGAVLVSLEANAGHQK